MPTMLLQIVVAIGLAIAVWLLADVVLLMFLGVLVACVLRGVAVWLASRTHLPVGAMLAAASLGGVLLLGAAGAWIAPELVREGQGLTAGVTREWQVLRQDLGQPVSSGSGGGGQMFGLHGIAGHWASPLRTVLGSTLNVAADAFVVIITALYLAASPDLYMRGALHLVPKERRGRLREVMARIGSVLRLWCLGQLVDMVIVGLLGAAGFRLAGVPAPYALGLLAGLLTFIPYFGAILAAVPATLIALTVGGTTALLALGVCGVCHAVEGYVVAPLVQRRLIDLPPALTVMSMTIAGTLFGVLGVALGTPLAAAGLVAVQMLYVEDALHDQESPGHPSP